MSGNRKINKTNAHPQLSQNSKISIVHNGIVENYQDLKLFLIKNGYKFNSETDTEVISNLIEFFLKKYDIKESLKRTLKEIDGSSSIVGINLDQPEKIFIMKKGNSGGLVISENNKNEKIISSDPTIINGFAESYRYLVDSEIAFLDDNKIDFIVEAPGKNNREIKLENGNSQIYNDVYQYKMEEEIIQE